MIETRQNELARLAVEDCLEKIEFGDVLIFSNVVDWPDGCRIVPVLDWPDKLGWSRFSWAGVAPYLHTTHALCIQWDSWVVNPEVWQDGFLDYDYVGAPWWYKDGRNVGNGGFSLRSTRLCRYLASHLAAFPCDTALDDDLLCRKYRPRLEEVGFTWAPESVAADFAFECIPPAEGKKTFGYHAMHNWGLVLPHDRLLERCRIAQKSPYITQNSWMWDQLLKRNPGLLEELG
jgi:hypothetical protein